MTALIIKKIITLFALVEPFSILPVFMHATSGMSPARSKAYARLLGVTVVVALLVAGLAGGQILSLLGITLPGMRVGGGIIVMILAVAMVLGQEKAVRQTEAERESAFELSGRGIVPLGIPLLAGPAALSYMITQSNWHSMEDVIVLVVPVLVMGVLIWATFHFAVILEQWITPATLNVIERLAGFLLAGLAADMIATGMRELFPVLGSTAG
jgi:multiple antibiotic resistance protein